MLWNCNVENYEVYILDMHLKTSKFNSINHFQKKLIINIYESD